MTRIIVKQLVWEKWTVVHIGKHNVSTLEVNTAIQNLIAYKRGHSGRYILIGRSGHRLISTIVRRTKSNTYAVITARDSDKKERRIVYEKQKK